MKKYERIDVGQLIVVIRDDGASDDMEGVNVCCMLPYRKFNHRGNLPGDDWIESGEVKVVHGGDIITQDYVLHNVMKFAEKNAGMGST